MVVGIDPGHDFDVGVAGALGVGVSEVAIPGIAELVIAPGPLLFAGGDMVIGDVDDAGLGLVVVAAEEVVLAADAHVGSGHGDIGVVGEVVWGIVVGGWLELAGLFVCGDPEGCALSIFHAVVGALSERVAAHRAAGVIGHAGDVRGEEALVLLVDTGGDVGPPEKRLGVRGAVMGADLEFDDGLVGVEADAVHAFHTAHGIVVAAPDRDAAVGVVFGVGIGGEEGCGTMVLGPVEFDTTGDPGAGKSDKCRFDDGLVIDEVVVVGFIEDGVDASAEFGEDEDFEVGIFEVDRFPGVRGGLL